MDEKLMQNIGTVLGRIPQGLWILTAQHEDHKGAMVISWVQQASFSPSMVSIAVAKGRSIMPLISESRRFGLCQVGKGDKLLLKKFAAGSDANEDPFLGMDLVETPGHHVPILVGAISYMVCEVVCHMDIEGDHDIFVGKIRLADFHQGEPLIHLRENGLKY